MPRLSPAARAAIGLRAARSQLYRQDKVWSRYSNDKVDIAHHLAAVLRRLVQGRPLGMALRGLSIGSSNEPQFRILESMCRGGLYLLDIEEDALAVVEERIARQATDHVVLIRGDYGRLLGDRARARRFRRARLGGRRVHLVTLHHSLYYSPEASWRPLVAALYQEILADGSTRDAAAAVHAVLMASESRDRCSTTWLYNHFACQYFGVHNDQDLRRFGRTLRREDALRGAAITLARSRVQFRAPDFEQLMGVVWMILLHPTVHRFSPAQQVAVIEHVYEHIWCPARPLVQEQDHLVIYRCAR